MKIAFSGILAAVLVNAAALPVPARAAELVMFERQGCPWCAKFDREVAPAYPRTPEGARAPLRRVDIHKPIPTDLAFVRREPFTPVFILIDGGREIGRIRGYPGDVYFWGLLAGLIEKIDLKPTDPIATH